MKFVHPAVILLASISCTFAQEPAFDGRIELRAPARANWDVALRPTAAMRMEERKEARSASLDATAQLPLGADDTLVKLKVEKSGPMYHETSYFGDGSKLEKWSLETIQFRELRGRNDLLGMAGVTLLDPDFSDHSKEDFEELGWLSKEFYKGIIQYENMPCFLFQTSGDKKPNTRREAAMSRFLADSAADAPSGEKSADAEKPATPASTKVTVILSVATRLPLMYNDGKVLRIYHYETANLPALQPPQKFASEFAAWQKHFAEVNRRPSAP